MIERVVLVYVLDFSRRDEPGLEVVRRLTRRKRETVGKRGGGLL